MTIIRSITIIIRIDKSPFKRWTYLHYILAVIEQFIGILNLLFYLVLCG